MAFAKSKSRKCPVCVGCTPTKVKQIDSALEPVLEDVKSSGEVPKASDKRFDLIAERVGIAPHSLRYHLKECMLDLEIQDQRFQELVDIVEALKTAKQEYIGNPSMANSTAYTNLLTQFRGLAEDIEGQQDPEVTVEFIVEMVLNSMSRQVLASTAEEIRGLRDAVKPLLKSPNHQTYIDSQMKAGLTRISTALRESLDESLKALCSYYKVELEAKARKRALEAGVTLSDSVEEEGQSSEEEGDGALVH